MILLSNIEVESYIAKSYLKPTKAYIENYGKIRKFGSEL